MICVLPILLLELALILPLAGNRGNLKRVLLLAVGIELIKYLFMFTVGRFFLNDGGIGSNLVTLFSFTAMLPEFLAGGEFGPSTIAGKVFVFCSGVVWNLAPAYLVELCLPPKDVPISEA